MAKGSLEILKNKIDVSKVLEQLNAALSEEWLSFYQYWIGALVAEGAMRAEIQKELQKHAEAEYKHAKLVADRIIELEGIPALSPRYSNIINCYHIFINSRIFRILRY